jgi:cell wall-associated NlpC family hydrolase
MPTTSAAGRARAQVSGARAAFVLAVVLALAFPVLLPAGPAQARPVYPSTDEIAEAQSEAAQTRDRVASLQDELIAADAELQDLRESASAANEAFLASQYRLRQAEAEADSAKRAASSAQTALAEAREELGSFAAASYRSGGDLANVGALMSADGPGALLDRANTINVLSTQREYVLARVESARVVAELLETQSAQALDTVETAAVEVTETRRQAQAAFDSQAAEVDALDARRSSLRAELTALDANAVRLADERAAGIAAAAARRAREAAERSSNRSNGGGGGSGPGSSTDNGDSGGGGAGPVVEAPNGTSSSTAADGLKAVAFAEAQLGKWYQWAGSGPDRFDCSGLTMRAWEKGGRQLGHYTVWQWEQTKKINISERRPGDLVFYAKNTNDYRTSHHMGIYVGGDRMIEAPYTGAKIRYASIWRSDLLGITRP